MKYEVSNYH